MCNTIVLKVSSVTNLQSIGQVKVTFEAIWKQNIWEDLTTENVYDEPVKCTI